MSEPSGMPSALGVEAVEWFARGEETLTVRVTGRWRRRRPAASPQPVLVVEAQGQRHRFPAMPEPPGLTGAAPGTWQMSFSVPAALAPALGGRAWLQLGAAVVPLPGPVDAGVPPEDPEATDVHAEEAERESDRVVAQLQTLQRQLEAARREQERLRAIIRAGELATLRARQLAHSERAQRAELQEELSRRGRPGTIELIEDQLAAARERVLELEAQVEESSRQLAEAEQVAACAAASRDRAVGAPGQANASSPSRSGMSLGRGDPARTLSRELSLFRAAPPMPPPRSRATLGENRVLAWAMVLAIERRLVATWNGLGSAALAAPAHSESGSRLAAVVAAVRLELRELRALAEREREDRVATQARAADLERALHASAARGAAACAAIDSLRRQLDSLRRNPAGGEQPDPRREIDAIGHRASEVNGGSAAAAPAPDRTAPASAPAPAAASPEHHTERADARPGLDPQRLDAALSRLREPQPPWVEAPSPPAPGSAVTVTRAWIEPVFRALTAEDAMAAGRLLLALLPAAHLVSAHRVRYDLILERLGCVHVTVPGGGEPVHVQLEPASRAITATDFTVRGDLAGLARLVARGSLRRGLFHRRARITGNRASARALLDLVRVPLGLEQWLSVGVRLDPWLACRLAALMVEPSWTVGESFTIAFPEAEDGAGGVCLHVRDGAYAAVGDVAFLDEPTTTVAAPGGAVLAILAGDTGAATAIAGDHGALARLQSWMARAQNGT